MMKGVGEFPVPAGFDRMQARAGSRGAASRSWNDGRQPSAPATARQILCLIQTDTFVPCFWALSRHLAGRGYRSMFAAFQPRERLWLRKNGIPSQPESVHALKNYPVKPGLFDGARIDEILAFAMQRSGGRREDWEQRLQKVAAFLDDLLDEHHFSAVLIWNGDDFIGKALAIIAGNRGIRTIFCENGYFPNTLQFDPEGVNVHSTVNRLSFAEILRQLDSPFPARRMASEASAGMPGFKPLAWTDLARCFLARKANLRYYRDFPEHRGGSWFISQWLRLKRSLVSSDQCTLPEKFIFIPFQVHDDTQILLNSKFFKSMEEFFEFCHAAIRRNFGEGYAIVVKEHPEDIARHSYARLRRRYPDVVWLRKFSVDTLIERAELVFVVNSSVGLQALQKGRPTVTFGESFYARKEVAFPVEELERVDEVIAQARLGMTPERRDRIEQLVRFLQERYFVPGGWRNASVGGMAAAGDRIIELIEATPMVTGMPGHAGPSGAREPLPPGSRFAAAADAPQGSKVPG